MPMVPGTLIDEGGDSHCHPQSVALATSPKHV